MILREATDDDLRPLHALCKRTWARQGVRFDPDFDRFRSAKASGSRTVVLYDSLPASGGAPDLLASLTAVRINTDRGVAFEITSFVVDQDRPDAVKLLDAISLYALNIGISEGCRLVISRRQPDVSDAGYAADIGMTVEQRGTDTKTHQPAELYQMGDAKRMMETLVKRNPQWALSL